MGGVVLYNQINKPFVVYDLDIVDYVILAQSPCLEIGAEHVKV